MKWGLQEAMVRQSAALDENSLRYYIALELAKYGMMPPTVPTSHSRGTRPAETDFCRFACLPEPDQSFPIFGCLFFLTT
jgi:hypothetical protein